MFTHNNARLPYPYYDYSSDFPTNFPFPETNTTHATFPLLPLDLPNPTEHEHDTLSPLRSEIGNTRSGCSSYSGSPTSYRAYSSNALWKSSEVYSLMSASPPNYFGPITSSVRKAPSAGDLQQGVNLAQHNLQSTSTLETESSIIESMSRASPYGPEEKKERIERYRSKRNLRNFNKKIKYECRKNLADSRPRIKGRFARNDEMEKTPHSHWDNSVVEEDSECDDNWINYLDPFSTNQMP